MQLCRFVRSTKLRNNKFSLPTLAAFPSRTRRRRKISASAFHSRNFPQSRSSDHLLGEKGKQSSASWKSFDQKLALEKFILRQVSKRRNNDKVSDSYRGSWLFRTKSLREKRFAADTNLISVMCNNLWLAEKNKHSLPYLLIAICSCRHFYAVKRLFDFVIDCMSFFRNSCSWSLDQKKNMKSSLV